MQHIKLLFRSAAVFNWLAAAALFAPLGIAAQLGVQPEPAGGPFEAIMVVAISVFGIGYWWVANSPLENLPIVKLGLLGKIAVVTTVYIYAWTGAANLTLAALASGDLVYSILFGAFLLKNPSWRKLK
jgi:hypothetical protein